MFWSLFIIKLGCSQSDCRDFFCQCDNQQIRFWTKRFIIYIFCFYRLLDKTDRLELPKVIYMYGPSLYKNYFYSKAICGKSSSRCQSTNFDFLKVSRWKLQVLLLSVQTWLPEKSYTCVCLWYLLRFLLICLQNCRKYFFHEDLNCHFHLSVKLLDKQFPKRFSLHPYSDGLKLVKT